MRDHGSRVGVAATLVLLLLGLGPVAATEDAKFPGTKETWHGFSLYKDKGSIVVVPHQIARGKPWVWRARFWGHEPQFDIALLEKGYHLVYCDVSNLYGNRAAVARWNAFYKTLREKHGLARKVVLEGMSRGGLIIYNWAIANPEKVAVIYGDAPVMDLKSWPGPAHPGALGAYGFKRAEEAKAYKGNPVDNLAPLAKAGVPIIHVVGDADTVVPVAENTAIAEKRYKELGGVFEVIHKAKVGHHPHSLKDPAPLVRFVMKHAAGKKGPDATAPSGGKKLRLFILSGQSNMAGMDPAVSFTPAVTAAYPNDEVLVVKSARGGQPIRRWFKKWAPPKGQDPNVRDLKPPVGDLYAVLMQKVKATLAGRKPDTVAFAWMQGERDAKMGWQTVYAASLKGLIQQLRDDLKHPAMVVSIGRLSDCLKGQEGWDAVRAAQEQVARDDPLAGWIDTDDLNNKGNRNDLHYTKDGYATLGRRYAAQLVKLLAKVKT